MFIAVNPKYTITSTPSERKRCLILLIIKIIHEFYHLLTNSFHELAGVEIEENFVNDTPIHIGTTTVSNKAIGDCGMEKEIFGGRIAVFDTILPYHHPLIIQIPSSRSYKSYYITDGYVDDSFVPLLRIVHEKMVKQGNRQNRQHNHRLCNNFYKIDWREFELLRDDDANSV